jgi:hypothetical protein
VPVRARTRGRPVGAEQDLPDYLDEIHQDIAEFFDRHADHLDEDFIDKMLESHGYQRTSQWALPDPQGRGGAAARKPGVKRGGGQPPRRGSYFGNR